NCVEDFSFGNSHFSSPESRRSTPGPDWATWGRCSRVSIESVVSRRRGAAALGIADRGQGADEASGHFVERLHELGDRGLHGAEQFGQELFPGGKARQGGDVLG